MLAARRTRRRVEDVGFWWHSIDVGNGVVTPGVRSPDALAHELEAGRLPDLAGRSVLDMKVATFPMATGASEYCASG